VLHPATLLPAIQEIFPVLVLNSRNPKCEGTRITAPRQEQEHLQGHSGKKRITVVDVVATRMLMAHGFLKSIFEVFCHIIAGPVDIVIHLRSKRLCTWIERVNSRPSPRPGQAFGPT